MNSKYFEKYSFLFVFASVTAMSAVGQDTTRPKQLIEEKLAVPFGTIRKMTIVIVDGDQLHDKGHQGSFLFRVKSVDSTTFLNPVTIEFKDETGKFPRDEFELYKYLYGKNAKTLSAKQSEGMKKKYVGKEFTVAAYETGEFTGLPENYFKYQPVRPGYGFHFRHYIIVVADLTPTKKG
jgi:hypothetical protein